MTDFLFLMSSCDTLCLQCSPSQAEPILSRVHVQIILLRLNCVCHKLEVMTTGFFFFFSLVQFFMRREETVILLIRLLRLHPTSECFLVVISHFCLHHCLVPLSQVLKSTFPPPHAFQSKIASTSPQNQPDLQVLHFKRVFRSHSNNSIPLSFAFAFALSFG